MALYTCIQNWFELQEGNLLFANPHHQYFNRISISTGNGTRNPWL